MTRTTWSTTETTRAAKWAEMSSAIDALVSRVADPEDFPVALGSSLAGDDAASHPFEVSQALRHLINAAVDQLHGAKTVVHDAGAHHLAVTPTLARAALENAATALWILGPRTRDLRIERVLRWHTRNYLDADQTIGLFRDHTPTDHKEQVLEVARRRPGIDTTNVARGYKISTPIKEAEEYTEIGIHARWALASAFTHGRPWAYQGLLERETLTVADGDAVHQLRPRHDLNLWLPLEALHLLGELLRLRDRQAGLPMPPMPDGSPDSRSA